MACVAGETTPRPTASPGASGDTGFLGSAAPEPTRAPVIPAERTFQPNEPYEPSLLARPGIVERLQAALDRARADLAAPGIAASVLLDDGHQWTGVAGFADLATKRALTASTPFAIASVSKTFLAAEILTLVGEGRLDLEDSAARLLPPDTLVATSPVDPRITVRMLLDHTSGLRDFLVDTRLDKAVQAAPAKAWTPQLALAYAGKPLAPPGEGYHYANTNYVLLGLIAERLTGRTLAEEYRARFFTPLGLTTATYQGLEPPAMELPTAYRYTSLKKDARPVDVTDGTAIRPFTAITTAAGAAGSVAASPRDLARWARALYGGHVLPDEQLSQMLLDAETTMTLKPSYPYGLGVQVFELDGHVSYGHSGRLVGARSAMRWFPEVGIAIAVTTNESRFDPTSVIIDLLAIVAPDQVAAGRPMD